MNRELTNTFPSCMPKFSTYVLYSLFFQQLAGVVAGIVVQRQVVQMFVPQRIMFPRAETLCSTPWSRDRVAVAACDTDATFFSVLREAELDLKVDDNAAGLVVRVDVLDLTNDNNATGFSVLRVGGAQAFTFLR